MWNLECVSLVHGDSEALKAAILIKADKEPFRMRRQRQSLRTQRMDQVRPVSFLSTTPHSNS